MKFKTHRNCWPLLHVLETPGNPTGCGDLLHGELLAHYSEISALQKHILKVSEMAQVFFQQVSL